MLNQIKDEKNIYAHLKDERKELLKEHINLSHDYYLKIMKESDFENVLKKLEEKMTKDYSQDFKEIWKDMIVNTILFHDAGKINPNYQRYKMKNTNIEKAEYGDSKHSLLSSILYVNYYYPIINKFLKSNKALKKEAYELLLFMYINSYIISKHHGFLESFLNFKKSINDKFKELNDSKGRELLRYFNEEIILTDNIINNTFIWEKNDKRNLLKYIWNDDNSKALVEKEWEENIYYYIYSKILFSLLVACDYYSTYEFMNVQEVKNFGENVDVKELMSNFKNTEEYKGIEDHLKNPSTYDKKDINYLRCEMFLEAQENFGKNIDKNIFYLEAPTGSGKTLTSINLCLKALEKNSGKIFYVFPFNTLVEQTHDSILNCLGKDIEKDIAVINSVTPIKYKDESEDNIIRLNNLKGENKNVNYDEMLLDRQFLHYPIILTTHVSFFNILFGTSRESVFPLIHLANSVIVLDEIQSYKNYIWIEIIAFLKKYAEVLNLKIIIMSATLPKLDELTNVKGSTESLIKNRDKYFKSELFKDRVKLDFSLLRLKEREEIFHAIEDLIKNEYGEAKVDILIEFITKKSALEFYKRLKELNLTKEVMILTGDDNRYSRKKIIGKIKDKERRENLILVATQVIEAGVDVDFDIGFKNLSILDAEEQFLGRINRSAKKDYGLAYFFKVDKNVITGDVRCYEDFLLINEEMQEILVEKDFNIFYSEYILKALKESKSKRNLKGIETNIKPMLESLDFAAIEKHMQLITEKDNQCSIFFDRDIDAEEFGWIHGCDVWKEYKDIIRDTYMGYAEKRVKLSRVQAKMDYFIYTVNKSNFPYVDVIGDIFYMGKGDKYFNEDVFNRDEFESDSGKFI